MSLLRRGRVSSGPSMILVFNNFIITQRRPRSVLRSAESVESWPGAGPGLPVCTSPRGVPHTTKAVDDRRLLIAPAAASGGCDRPTQARPDASSIGHDAAWNHRRRQSPDLQSRDSSQGWFCPQGVSGSFWKSFWLSELREGGYWDLTGRGQGCC